MTIELTHDIGHVTCDRWWEVITLSKCHVPTFYGLVETYDTWHLTNDKCHMAHDMWHVTHGGGWASSKKFSSLALTVWERWCFGDWEENGRHRNYGPFWRFLAPFGPFWYFLHHLALFGHSLKSHDFWYFNKFIWIVKLAGIPCPFWCIIWCRHLIEAMVTL